MLFTGLFTDKAFCLRVIKPHLYDATIRIVYCSYTIDDVRINSDAHTHGKLVLKDDGTCTFATGQNEICNGTVNEKLDRILWDTGDIWQKLVISPIQIHSMFYRPYMPLTFFIVTWICKFCQMRCRNMLKFSPSRIRVVYSTCRSSSTI